MKSALKSIAQFVATEGKRSLQVIHRHCLVVILVQRDFFANIEKLLQSLIVQILFKPQLLLLVASLDFVRL